MGNTNNAKVIVDYADMVTIADAIRSRNNSTESMAITEMPAQIGDIGGSGENALIKRNFSVYENGTVTTIGDNAFCHFTNLTSVSFPMCTSIGASAFYYCSNLTTVSFPICTNIGDGAFYYCSHLTTANFPACTNISNNAFYRCYSLTTADFPACTTIGNNAFSSCTDLVSVNFPVCISMDSYAFRGCGYLPTASFPACNYIGSSAFHYCSSLATLYLTGSSFCTLAHSNALFTTSIKSTTGSIFVNASLVDQYKSAPHWSYFSNVIYAYEG